MRVLWITVLLFLAGCGNFPNDPEGTLERVQGGKLRVGYAVNEPWVTAGKNEAGGIEAEVVKAFAASLEAEVDWVRGSPDRLLTALSERQLDIVIGGFTRQSPWKKHVAFSKPFMKTPVFIYSNQPGLSPDDIKNKSVAVFSGSQSVKAILKKGGLPVIHEDSTNVPGLYTAYSPITNQHASKASEEPIDTEEHVVALPPGENAFVFAFEKFIDQKKHAK